jgi:selenide,water dikinase
MGPEALAHVLRPLAHYTHPDLLVGLQTSDDAAVFRLSPELALVQTVDFFTPIVDDPVDYGAIAAANSLSDVYAMGGRPVLCLAVGGFPEDLPPDLIADVFRGAAEVVAAAGAVLAGGHTVTDKEPKYGLAVTGLVHPETIWRKGEARPGDRLYLTKPLGTGVVATALKRGQADAVDVAAAVASMRTLNQAAAEAARQAGGVHACTDITGFGLLGHAAEMATRGPAGLRIVTSALPLLPGARRYADAGALAGGLWRNRQYYETAGPVRYAAPLDEGTVALLWDPQTSGGLLLALDPAAAADFELACAASGQECWPIGEAMAEPGVTVVA